MSWPTGQLPAEVTAMRDMLALCTNWTANGGSQAQVHYPDFTASNSTVFPACLIVRESHNRDSYAAGSAALPNGRMRLELYLQDVVAGVEAIAQGIAADLAASTSGLAIRSCETELAGEISDARQAAIDDSTSPSFRCAIISVAYGLTL
jgi:hypothetical protein